MFTESDTVRFGSQVPLASSWAIFAGMRTTATRCECRLMLRAYDIYDHA